MISCLRKEVFEAELYVSLLLLCAVQDDSTRR